MNRHDLVVGSLILVVIVVASVALLGVWSGPSEPLDSDQTYPPGAGPDHINFSTLGADDANLTHTPRRYWESYAILYAAPSERRLVEGEYYINATTGEIIADRWHDAKVYRNGTTYVFYQPADSLPEHQREQFRSDPAFVYDNTTDAYYRYDPRYGQIAPTNIGRHTMVVDSYTWEAINTTTHHGVPVITYRVTGTRPDSQAPPAINGTLQLGLEDGIIYAYDITKDAEGGPYRYTYSVRPAPFPEHEWVDTARDLTGNTTESSSR
ncbi:MULTISPECIES: hypothetical protein [Haloarcula]|uniref:hypothetical protein n=1 Tax=Haloarcula TaxID=2237 RepID=UPI0023ECC19F|nr:hypothetical protein [Halomicroarcula sp. XH51]